MKKIYKFVLFFNLVFLSNAWADNNQPSIAVNGFDGRIFDLKEKKGKVVIVNLWAKWCIDCRVEMPILEEIYQKYKSQGLEIIGLSTDSKNQRDKVIEYAKEFSFANSMFEEAKENSFEKPKVIPIIYVIDKNGKEAAKIIGDGKDAKSTKAELEKILKTLL